MVCDTSLASHLKNQINTFFPGSFVRAHQEGLNAYFDDQTRTVIVDFGLSRNFVLPLQTFRSFGPDPLTGFLSSFGNLLEGERALFQVIFQKARFQWAEQLQAFFSNPNCKNIPGNNHFSSALKEKLSRPLFAVVLRLAVSSVTKQHSWEILKQLGTSFSLFSSPDGNELIALSNNGYSQNNHFFRFLAGRVPERDAP